MPLQSVYHSSSIIHTPLAAFTYTCTINSSLCNILQCCFIRFLNQTFFKYIQEDLYNTRQRAREGRLARETIYIGSDLSMGVGLSEVQQYIYIYDEESRTHN